MYKKPRKAKRLNTVGTKNLRLRWGLCYGEGA